MKEKDKRTGWVKTVSGPHGEIHEGKFYSVHYNVADLGAMTTPDDAIQLTWTTPVGPARMNLTIHAQCGAAALYKFTEAWTGAGITATGTIVGYNRNRAFPNSSITFSYDATLVTGGTVLQQEYITTGKFDAGESRDSQEWILKPNTPYAVSLFLGAAEIATLSLDWYMKTDRH